MNIIKLGKAGDTRYIFPEFLAFETIGVVPMNGFPLEGKEPMEIADVSNIDIKHPNRPNKRRGDKLNNYNHVSTPYSNRDRTIIADRQISRPKSVKKPYRYKLEYQWDSKWLYIDGQVPLWSMGGKYRRLKDAEEAWEAVVAGRGIKSKIGDKFQLLDMRTGAVLREMTLNRHRER